MIETLKNLFLQYYMHSDVFKKIKSRRNVSYLLIEVRGDMYKWPHGNCNNNFPSLIKGLIIWVTTIILWYDTF